MSTSQARPQLPNLPLVSVLMPAYNHERYVEQAVRSVWNQSYKNIELIALDDGSADTTGEILERLALISPIRMYVERKENQGVCDTLNRALEISKGEWVALLASDDYYDLNYIFKAISVAKTHAGKNIAIHCDAIQVDRDGELGARISKITKNVPAAGDAFMSIARNECRIVPSTLIVSKEVYNIVGNYDTSLIAEDHDMHLRISRVAEFIYIDDPLFFSRHLEESLGRKPALWANDIFKALDKHKEYLAERYTGIVRDRSIGLTTNFLLAKDVHRYFECYFKAIQYSDGPIDKLRTTALVALRSFVLVLKTFVRSLVPKSLILQIKRDLYR